MKKTKPLTLISFILIAFVMTLSGCAKRKAAYKTASSSPYDYSTSDYAKLPSQQGNTEEYKEIEENSIMDVLHSPLSTFSIDVDTASYSNVRRYIMGGELPPRDAVRIEELINYFTYDYPQPKGDDAFSVTTEVAPCPWNDKRLLAMIGIQGKKVINENLPPSNLVFLLDVSGSMGEPNKLPLVKSAMKLLVDNLTEKDKISIVVYADNTGVVLKPTSGDNKEKINAAIDKLEAGGSTAGGEGIQLAYKLAKESFIKNGNNRVILATDGDFNVGVSSDRELEKLIEEKRKDGIFLSVLGFGDGNLKDSKMETLADKGNGNYAYIDSILEAKKVLIEEMGSTLLTIAKDVKIQVEFNPVKIKGYRLIGYENRKLNNEDFNDDTKDAGELGAGHSVTAFYELIPTNSDEKIADIDDLKYQDIKTNGSNDLMTIKLRYKQPDSNESVPITLAADEGNITSSPSENFKFASSVAEFGLLLRDSEYKGSSTFEHVINTSRESKGEDLSGYRAEFIKLAGLAESLKKD